MGLLPIQDAQMGVDAFVFALFLPSGCGLCSNADLNPLVETGHALGRSTYLWLLWASRMCRLASSAMK